MANGVTCSHMPKGSTGILGPRRHDKAAVLKSANTRSVIFWQLFSRVDGSTPEARVGVHLCRGCWGFTLPAGGPWGQAKARGSIFSLTTQCLSKGDDGNHCTASESQPHRTHSPDTLYVFSPFDTIACLMLCEPCPLRNRRAASWLCRDTRGMV